MTAIRMRRFGGMLTVSLLLAACNAGEKALDEAAQAISEDAYRQWVSTLASDEFEGRGPGTPGGERTVEYLERQFLELGLQPADGVSFRQQVGLVEITATDPTLAFAKGKGGMQLAFGDDMVIGTRRVVDQVSVKDSEVVFVGYGIVAPEYGWNDYAGVDMRGKTALILVNDPGFKTGDLQLFRGKAMTYYGRWTYKFEEAARQGAAAAIIVHETAPAAYGWHVVRNGWSGPQLYSETPDGNAGRSAIEGWITRDRALQLMEMAGRDLEQMEAAALKPGFQPVPLGVTASAGLRNAIRRASSPNVAGLLRGRGKPDEYVVYMAHWDHLGRALGFTGDTIYNGAVDNATGVAGILAIARAFRELRPAPERSILFLAVTAEESGLIGSEHYVMNPLVPLEKTAAVFNIDAHHPLGRARDIEVIGYGASQLEDLLRDAAKAQGRVLKPDATPEHGYFYRSDHFNFAKKGVPALYVKAGTDLRDGQPGAGQVMKDDYTANRYHKPSDDYDPAWDVSGIIEDMRLLFRVGAGVAAGGAWPNWYEGNEFRAARDASAAARGATGN